MSDTVIVGLGSNLGNRRRHLIRAKNFLSTVAVGGLAVSSIYRSDAIGPAAKHEFLNAVTAFETGKKPEELLAAFKSYEFSAGRDPGAPRWSDRPIDLDIIAFGKRIVTTGALRIPHPEYSRRLFVLLPLAELFPTWSDPQTGASIDKMIAEAPRINVTKTNLEW